MMAEGRDGAGASLGPRAAPSPPAWHEASRSPRRDRAAASEVAGRVRPKVAVQLPRRTPLAPEPRSVLAGVRVGVRVRVGIGVQVRVRSAAVEGRAASAASAITIAGWAAHEANGPRRPPLPPPREARSGPGPGAQGEERIHRPPPDPPPGGFGEGGAARRGMRVHMRAAGGGMGRERGGKGGRDDGGRAE